MVNFWPEPAAATSHRRREHLRAAGARKRINVASDRTPRYMRPLSSLAMNKSVAIVDVDSIGFDPEWTDRIIDAVAGSDRACRAKTFAFPAPILTPAQTRFASPSSPKAGT